MIGEKYTLRVSKKDNGVKIFNNYDENNWRVLNVHYQNYEDAVYLQIKLKPLVDLLNELYKENEKLKKENNQLQRYVYHCPQFCKRILAYLGKCEEIQRFSFRTVEKVPGIYDDTAEKIFFLIFFVDIGALIDLLNQFDNVNNEFSNMLKKYDVYAERLKAKNLMLENIIEMNKCYIEELKYWVTDKPIINGVRGLNE